EIPLPCIAVRQLLQPPAIQEARRSVSCAALDLPPTATATEVAVPVRTQRRSGTAVPVLRVPPPPPAGKVSGVGPLLKTRPGLARPASEWTETPTIGQQSNIDTEFPDLRTPPHGNPPVESWLPDLTAPPPSRGTALSRWWWSLVIASLLFL